MSDKVRTGTEAPPTHRTLVWFLSRVNPLVSYQVRTHPEVFTAAWADVGFLSRVGSLVGEEV